MNYVSLLKQYGTAAKIHVPDNTVYDPVSGDNIQTSQSYDIYMAKIPEQVPPEDGLSSFWITKIWFVPLETLPKINSICWIEENQNVFNIREIVKHVRQGRVLAYEVITDD